MLTVTFVRHGESEDNVKSIWAGWKDAPLSSLGNQQAAAVAKFFQQSNTIFSHIYASDLLRAHNTGKAIHALQPPSTLFTVLPSLREQHFGAAEGNPWAYRVSEGETVQSMIEKGVYPVLFDREEKYEGGESLEDLRRRAEGALRESVLLNLGEEGDEKHIALASHGLCISELVKALLSMDPEADLSHNYTGLLNTAWTRVTVQRREENKGLQVIVTDVNRSEHLETVEPSAPAEGDNNDARAFFGGKADTTTATIADI